MGGNAKHPAIILGFAATGRSVARYLGAYGLDAIVTDDDPARLVEDSSEFGNCRFVNVSRAVELASTGQARAIYASPGVPPSHPLLIQAHHLGLNIASDIDIFFAECPAPVISVTGTNGKSTIATLIHRLCEKFGVKARLGGNIGTPALDLLDGDTPDHYILELSSFQLHHATPGARNRIGVLANIGSDHLDYHGGLRNYIASKRRVFDHNEFSVFCRDQSESRLFPANSNASFGLGRSSREQDYGLLREGKALRITRGHKGLFELSEGSERPLCYLANAMAALATVERLGIAPEEAVEPALAMPLLEHRFDRIDSDDGIRWINASKATNPPATIASLPPRLDRLILLLGGNRKGVDIRMLKPYLQGIKGVIAYASEAKEIAACLSDGAPVSVCSDLEDAVARSASMASPGDTVLLAPAGSSQPDYIDYAERGRRFAELVRSRPAPLRPAATSP